MQSSPRAPLRTMVARVSPQDTVLYANGSLCAYLGLTKQEVLGASLELVASRCQGEIVSCFSRPHAGRVRNHLVTDFSGRVFEAKRYSEGGVLDIVLDEVTSADLIGVELRNSTGTPFEALSEEELRTARQPERRYLTVLYTQLKGVSETSEGLAPMELRLMVNSFIEEAADAILESGSTLGEMVGDALLGVFGAPRHYLDHPLRAVRAACEQMAKTTALHTGFFREGKEMPPCSCGLWTGETLVGTLGNSVWQHYTALGKPVELARRLCELARPGEIVLPEHTLTHLLRVLPDGWEHVRAERDQPADLSDFRWSGEEISPIPEHLSRVVYLVGPGVRDDPDRAEFFFDYLWSFQAAGREQSIPILRVVRPAAVGDSLTLSDDNLVGAQAVQTLGKYKLIEVVGTGGMGRVWRGVDRFGNAVAIKVLHGSELVTETQLKRFRREAEIMATLPHRNICRVYEMNEYEGIQFIAMEFVSGLPLYDLLHERTRAEVHGASLEDVDLPGLIKAIRLDRESAPPPEEEVERPKSTRILPFAQTLQIVFKVCDAVQFAHEHGVLHRDLKPGNILLREDGEPLVADFGLAKLSTSDSVSLSVTGHVVGTFENMAPEQAESSKDVDERADVYSLGTILYQMITGKRHFEPTGNIVMDAQALRGHEPIRPRQLNPQVDSDLEVITLKALRADPLERYRSVSALRADIERYRRGEVILAKPVTPIDLLKKLIQRYRALTFVITLSLLIFITGAIVSIAILMRQLKNEQQATQEATRQRALAEEQRSFAEQQRAAAEQQEHNAREAQARAVDSQQKAEAALAEARDARAYGAEANAKSEAERKLRENAEQAAKSNEAQLQETRRLVAELETKQSATPQPDATPDAAAVQAQQASADAFREASRVLSWELTPMEVKRLEKTPDEIVRRLGKSLDLVSQALLLNPQLAPAWMLKGRLHFAMLEFGPAADSFSQAAAIKDPAIPPRDIANMAEVARSCASKPSKASDLIAGADLPFGEQILDILRLLSDRSRHSTGLTSDILPGRTRTPNEMGLLLLARNPGMDPPEIKPSPSGRLSISLDSDSDIVDLSILRSMDVEKLSITSAPNIDWLTLYQIPLDSLNLSDSRVGVLPSPRAFLKLRELNLSGTSISNLDAIRQMPLLDTLSLADTQVADLMILSVARRLRVLDLTGLDPANLRILLNLPLEALTLSPDQITDKQSLLALRLHRTLRILRTPDDPEDLRASVFWERYDQGNH